MRSLSLSAFLLISCPLPGLAQASTEAAPASSSAPSGSTNSLSQPESYTLGAGDRIQITIFQVPDYSGENVVLVDGTLNLPVAGSVSVRGMTLNQAADAIAIAYGRILRRPLVTVSLITPRPLQLGIAGEVNRPGAYTLSPEGAQFPTLTKLLEMAGGVRQTADLRQVQVRRSQFSGPDQVINIDLWQLLETGNLQYDLTLRDGDSVFIPTAETTDLSEAPQIAAASFAADSSQPINIAVVGEVFRPGPYTATGGTARTGEAGVPGGASGAGRLPTVTRAIQVAGGIRPMADVRQIEVHRQTRTGTEQIIEVDLWKLLTAGDLSQDVILQEGDTVVVPTFWK